MLIRIVLILLLAIVGNAFLCTKLITNQPKSCIMPEAYSRLFMSTANKLTVQPISKFQGEVTLPGSKSLSNRVLLLAALSKGTIQIDNLLESADTQYMVAALKQLASCKGSKLKVDVDFAKKQAIITGNEGPFTTDTPQTIFLGNAGTAMRPLTAVLCAGEGEFILDGTPRMRERPIIDLVDGLQQLGCDITCSPTGCPPVVIKAGAKIGGITSISGQISSQYLSAILMMSPLIQQPVTVHIKDELMSAPYVSMTMNLIKKFGVQTLCNSENLNKDFISQPASSTGYIAPKQMFIEGDASSASYFLAGAAITGGEITVHGCGEDSIQGDSRFAAVLEKMGATVMYHPNSITVTRDLSKTPFLQGIEEDCGDIPDVAMTLAIVSIFAKGKTMIKNVYNWRVKETERMVALVTELTKLGVKVEEGRDYLVVHGLEEGQKLKEDVDIETYDDHRVAMCFALAACGNVRVNILDPGCTSKTFPEYFDVLKEVTIPK